MTFLFSIYLGNVRCTRTPGLKYMRGEPKKTLRLAHETGLTYINGSLTISTVQGTTPSAGQVCNNDADPGGSRRWWSDCRRRTTTTTKNLNLLTIVSRCFVVFVVQTLPASDALVGLSLNWLP